MHAHDAIPARQGAVDALLAQLFPPAPAEDRSAEPALTGTPGAAPPDDADLLDRACRSRQGAKIAALWHGELAGYPSESEADAALCSYLAFWTGPDPARLDALFRQSGRMRTKWERASYREPTLELAFKGRTTYYDPQEAARVEARFHLDGAAAGAEEGGAEEGEGEGAEGPSTDPADYEPTDTGNGQLFAARFADELRFDHRRGLWLRWMGHWWQEDADGHAFRLSEHIARAWAIAAVHEADERRQRTLRKWAATSQSLARREALLTIAGRARPLTTDGAGWDAEPFLLGVQNGVLDLETGALHDGRPGDRITMHSPAPYDPDARAPRWERFLREVFRDDEDLIAYVQRCAGYSLTGDTSEEVAFICFGQGANGKSKLLGALAHACGAYAYAAPFTMFERGGEQSISNDLAALAGRRLVTASETKEGQQLNEARLKTLTGGDPITARFLYREPFTFRPALKLWLAVNHKPVSRDDSRGFWRRIRLIPFLANFEDHPEKGLDRTLAAEAAGVLAWMVRGCLAWRRDGLETPATVVAATEAYRQESDLLGEFLSICCHQGQGQTTRADTLYRAYQDWAEREGLREREQFTRQSFGRRLGERFARGHDRQGTFYRGVGIALDWRERQTGDRR